MQDLSRFMNVVVRNKNISDKAFNSGWKTVSKWLLSTRKVWPVKTSEYHTAHEKKKSIDKMHCGVESCSLVLEQ